MSTEQPSPKKILIVDDVPENIKIVATILREEGYSLAFAQNGAAAIEQALSFPYDLILLDVMMPGMDGFQVCERLRKNTFTKEIPIIFLTGKTDIESIVKGFEAGGMDYLTKPFSSLELIARVKTQIELYRSQTRLRLLNKKLMFEILEREKAEKALKETAEKFKRLSIQDSLTGLYNTRYLYLDLEDQIADSQVHGTPLSLIFLDMDDFKLTVDTYGHINGSRALRQVAQTLKGSIEGIGYGVAYGGDEFVIVLPRVPKKEALQIAGEVRQAIIHRVYLTDQELEVRLTASFGVATYPDDASELVQLLSQADQAMFKGKKAGKNAIVSS